MTIAVITGGRYRPTESKIVARLTLAEYQCVERLIEEHGVTVIREGEARGTDKAVAAYVRARGLAEVERWPAQDFGAWPSCGPRRNRGMLDGKRPGDLVGSPADRLFAFRGGRGTSDCCGAALERGIPTDWVPDADEPRPWNMHHGSPWPPDVKPTGRLVYVGRSKRWGGPSPLANPYISDREDESKADGAKRILGHYARWLRGRIDPKCPTYDPAVVRALEDLGPDDFVGCTCWPSPCHVEVVIRAWRWLRSQ